MKDENGKAMAKRNLNMIINKSVMFSNYVKEEEERRSFGVKSVDYTPNKQGQKGKSSEYINNFTDIFFPSAAFSQMSNINLMPSTNSQSNLMYDDRMYRSSHNCETYPYIDPGLPLMSPINSNTKLYPTSTRNYFNVDFLNEGNYQLPLTVQSYNMFRQPMQGFFTASGFMTSPNNLEMTGMGLSPIQQNPQQAQNKEILLHNKILINESDLIGIQKYNTARNINFNLIETSKKEEYLNQDMRNSRNNANIPSTSNNLIDYSEIQMLKKKSSDLIKRPSLDLAAINDNETGSIFKQSLGRNVNELQPGNILSSFSNMKANSNFIPAESSAVLIRNEDKENNSLVMGRDNTVKHTVESNTINKTVSLEEFDVVPVELGDRLALEEEKINNIEISRKKSIETISASNDSEKSEDQESNLNNINSINEANINRLSLINMYSLSNVNKDYHINKPQVETTSATQQLQQESKAILNISPKSAFVKMK